MVKEKLKNVLLGQYKLKSLQRPSEVKWINEKELEKLKKKGLIGERERD